MSERRGFIEGVVIGAILGGLSVLIASPKSRRDLQDMVQKVKDDNLTAFKTTQESTEDLIERTKQSIEKGFDRLGDIIKENQKVSAEDIFTNKEK